MLSRDEWWVATCAACSTKVRVIEVERAQRTAGILNARGLGPVNCTDEALALAIALASGWRDNRGPGGRGLCPTCASVDSREVPHGSVGK